MNKKKSVACGEEKEANVPQPPSLSRPSPVMHYCSWAGAVLSRAGAVI